MCYTLRQPASRRPPFAFLSVGMPESRQVFEVVAAKTSKLVNLVLSSQTVFFNCKHPFIDNQWSYSNWARCTRRTAIRPGFENVFQQQAAHAAYSQQRSYSYPSPPPPKKKKFISIVLNFSWDDCNTQKKSKTKVIQKFGGKLGVLWEISANGEWNYFTTIC